MSGKPCPGHGGVQQNGCNCAMLEVGRVWEDASRFELEKLGQTFGGGPGYSSEMLEKPKASRDPDTPEYGCDEQYALSVRMQDIL